MSAEDLAWAAETLVEAERRKCVSRVTSVEAGDAVAKGDNYSSDLQRLKMTVVLHSGEVQKRSIIYKALPKNPHRKLFQKKLGNFANEAKVFTDVLSEMNVLMREKEGDPAPLWPEFYGVQKRNDSLLLEDLCPKGYRMLDRQKGMDFKHATLAVRSLAKFHALAAILRQRGDLNSKDFDRSHLVEKREMMYNTYKNSFIELAKVLETKWKGEWVQYADKLSDLAGLVTDNEVEFHKKKDTERFYTLNHGDCWLNNIMFRYGRNGEPLAVRFLDFQKCQYNHPGFDLQYFLQTSLDLEARPRKSELLQKYHSSLEENLVLYGYSGPVPTYADILDCYRSVAHYGLGFTLRVLPITLIPPDRAPDLDDVYDRMSRNQKTNMFFYEYEGEYFINTLKHILKEAHDDGLL